MNPLVLTIDDAARPITIVEDQWIIFRFASNPSAGFRWILDPADVDKFAIHGEPTYVARSGQGVGAGGTQIWSMSPLKAGEYRLHFTYRRPREASSEGEKEAIFNIQVAPK